MKNKNGMDTAYNVQTAVDSETHLMVDYQMTNRVVDHGLLESTAEVIKAEAGDRLLETVADKGYEQSEDIIGCLKKDVVLPDGRNVYELETAYEGIIEGMEVAVVRERIVDEPVEMAEPYKTEEAAKEWAAQGYYIRSPERDKVYYPDGAVLRHKSIRPERSRGQWE